jgi:hypothetical protein
MLTLLHEAQRRFSKADRGIFRWHLRQYVQELRNFLDPLQQRCGGFSKALLEAANATVVGGGSLLEYQVNCTSIFFAQLDRLHVCRPAEL